MKQGSKIALWAAAGVATLMCLKKRSTSGVGNLVRDKKTIDARREFAYNYLMTGAKKLNPQYIEQFVEEFATGRLKAMANGGVKFGGRRVQSYALNQLVKNIEWAWIEQFVEFGTWDKDGNEISGIGALYVPRETIIKARRLFAAFDRAVEIERENNAKSDAIFDQLDAEGIDWMNTAEGERIANERLFRAGLTDENGMTDVSVNRSNARKELLNYIYNNILPYFPLSKSDVQLFKENTNYTLQEKLLDTTRKFLQSGSVY